MTEILSLLRTFTSVRQRMLVTEASQARDSASLQSLSRDAVLLSLIETNSQERLVRPLVDRLGQNITCKARNLLLASYSDRCEN